MNRLLFYRGEPGYEAARVGRVFNARRPDRHPAAVHPEGNLLELLSRRRA